MNMEMQVNSKKLCDAKVQEPLNIYIMKPDTSKNSSKSDTVTGQSMKMRYVLTDLRKIVYV